MGGTGPAAGGWAGGEASPLSLLQCSPVWRGHGCAVLGRVRAPWHRLAILPCAPCARISARSGGLSSSPEMPWVSPHLLALSRAASPPLAVRCPRPGLCPFTAFPVALPSLAGGGRDFKYFTSLKCV